MISWFFKLCFLKLNVHRYSAGRKKKPPHSYFTTSNAVADDDDIDGDSYAWDGTPPGSARWGAVQAEPSWTHSLKAPGFNP